MELTRTVFALGLLAALSIPAQLKAQAVYGNVVGTVTDESGGAVPNAKVTIRDMDRDVTTRHHNQRIGQLQPALSDRRPLPDSSGSSGFPDFRPGECGSVGGRRDEGRFAS